MANSCGRSFLFYTTFLTLSLSMGRLENIVDIQDKVTFYKHTVCDEVFMHDLLLKEKFDYIYYLAAVSSVADSVVRPWYTHLVNQESVVNTLEFIRTNNLPIRKFLFTSSAAVYGNAADFPKTEDSHVDPLTPYAIDKYASERYTIDYGRLYNIPTVAVRFFNVYGPRQNPNSEYSGVLSIVTKCLKENKPFTLYGDGSQTRDFVYVEDVVDALIKISTETNEPTVYNCSYPSIWYINF
ncbi:NAD-dependent epimerase/dehydratase family protein [Limosilactobacillus fermentum]|uniref:NAD-dependent epimerase/dehydratase family protein n=1 Tax=Limosilactobacillus fermentum TaxID=1613 RepID=UPI0021CAEFE5|nr:NAD-dependent epimerase/dehydratase family protein [Limosilactobacillus fermentum]